VPGEKLAKFQQNASFEQMIAFVIADQRQFEWLAVGTVWY
jgi:hypothetical protein